MGQHKCRANNCEAMLPRNILMCKKHWFMVPKPLRDAIWSEWRKCESGNMLTPAYIANVKQAAAVVGQKEAGHAG